MKNEHSPRRTLYAGLLACCIPGLGQVYNGELIKAACFLLFFLTVPQIILHAAGFLPAGYLLVIVVLAIVSAIGVYLWAIIDAVKTSTRLQIQYITRAYNSGIVYLAVFIFGWICLGITENYARTRIVAPYKIVSRSMGPAVLQGDYVFVDRMIYRHGPVKVGDIIIHVYPDDRSMVYIRRVAALPGESVTYADGTTATAPHGSVLVSGGDNGIEHTDSRDFGPIDLRDLVGRVQQIYFSIGPSGVRWNRIGKVIEGEK
ncbi:signal peptidase I [Desulforhopalus sp. 52FAK]